MRQTRHMTLVRPASDASAADWLFRADVAWWELVRYGPPGFAVYVRISFAENDDENPASGEDPTLRTALTTLARCTSSADGAYAAIWEGWGGDPPTPVAPRVEIENRPMLLFTGPVELLRDAPSLAWYGSVQDSAEPHLVWPEDRAWCLACDVDEEVEFSVGCSVDAAEALARALPGVVRQVRYGEPAPVYRDEIG